MVLRPSATQNLPTFLCLPPSLIFPIWVKEVSVCLLHIVLFLCTDVVFNGSLTLSKTPLFLFCPSPWPCCCLYYPLSSTLNWILFPLILCIEWNPDCDLLEGREQVHDAWLHANHVEYIVNWSKVLKAIFHCSLLLWNTYITILFLLGGYIFWGFWR